MLDFHKKRAKRMTDQRKRQEILRWIASLTVTTVIAVVAFVLPSAPVGEFLRLETFGDAIYYETSVRDAESAIVDGTLKIRLEAPLFSEERVLSLGKDSGAFSGLPRGKTYTITILSDLGFGETHLAQETLSTLPEPGGRILGHDLWKTETPMEQMTWLYYRVDTLLVDPEGIYEEAWLEAAIRYDMETGSEPPMDDEFVPVEPDPDRPGSYLMHGLPEENLTVYLRLVALTTGGTTVVLDSTEFSTPLQLYASLYVQSAERRAVEVVFYPDSYHSGITYDLLVSRDGKLLQTIPLTVSSDESEGEPHAKIRVTGLAPSTEYLFELRAAYVEPESDVPVVKVIQSLPVMTLGDFQTSWTFTPGEGTVTVDGRIEDPDGQLRYLSCYVFTLLPDGSRQWFGSGNLPLTEAGEDRWVATGTVQVPDVPYLIVVQGTLVLSETIGYSISLAEYESANP